MKPTFTYKNIWSIAYPIILGSIAQNIVNITDTAFLGHYGQVELAASAIAGIFYFGVFMLGYGFAIGTQIIIARRNGEQNYKDIGKNVDHAIYFVMLLAIVLFVFLRFISPYVLKMAISSPQIYEKTVDFIQIRSFGLFFAFISSIIAAFYVGITKTKVITMSYVFMSIVNILFACILIFGNLGFSAYGIKGAAYANVFAEISAVLFFIGYTVLFTDLKKYDLFRFLKPVRTTFNTLITISFPVMIQFLISMSAWLIFFLLVEKMGERSLAVSNIVRSVYIVLMIPIWGFGAAVNTLVSNLMGQKKLDEVMPVIYKTLILCSGFIIIPVIFTFIAPELWIKLYTSDISIIEDCISPLYVVNSVMVFIATAFILFHGVTGTGKTGVSLIIETSVIVLYLSYVFIFSNVFKTSVALVWTSEFIYALFLALFSFLYLRYGKWQKLKI
ncbi:MAG: hypothetical protein A2491_05055 [Bacteroidetes bacterium RIFOXYC12_FULL_35_7]|nr:MAG: hypothetical protein A2491_05055 [Bacteroidetes bacterium RIFOXYC12_FULL_35_7]